MNTIEEHYLDDEQVADIIQDISDRMKFPVFGAGGGFAPIGTVAYFDGTQAPVGWLLCNGQVVNITDYPELAAYFASHHGSSNYYGGNGTTTFGVPTCKGMPDSPTYSTSEHIVDVWTDGKPLYAKTVFFTKAQYTSSSDIAHGISNIDQVIDFDLKIVGNNGSLLPLQYENAEWYIQIIEIGRTYVTVHSVAGLTQYTNGMYITIRYTKTTDSAVVAGHSADGKGVFCIKATVAGDPNGHVYSTEEHVVGQDENGKNIYEKIIYPWQKVASWTNTIDLTSLNIDKIEDIKGSFRIYLSNIYYRVGCSSTHREANGDGIAMYYRESDKSFHLDITHNADPWSTVQLWGRITIQYTKTS